MLLERKIAIQKIVYGCAHVLVLAGNWPMNCQLKKNEMVSMAKMITQYAALPIRQGKKSIEVSLVTSRYSKRWIIPKGWPEKKLTPWQAAAREAFEEAGLKGKIEQKPLGTFEYNKWLKPGKTVRCKVKVYSLDVRKELENWPEAKQRKRIWVSNEKAAELVAEPELKSILRKLDG